jgi:hypothetical protein
VLGQDVAHGARQQGPFDWQVRLESKGSVTFGPSRWSSWVLFAVAVVALLGCLYAVVSDGPATWSVVGTLVLAACAVVAGRAALLGTSELEITHDGFRTGRHPVVPFDRLGAVAIARRNLTLHYAAQPGERLIGRQRTTGQKMMIVTLPRLGSFHPDDLAIWLLKLKSGPTAEVTEERTGISRSSGCTTSTSFGDPWRRRRFRVMLGVPRRR